MDAIGEDDLQEIERRIVSAMVETFSIDLSGLVLDMTNFATWIDSANERAPIAKRGHSKQKRSDLRICGLGLVVSTDGGVPIVSHAYPGNKPDVTQFPAMVSELVARFGALLPDGQDRKSDRLTLVYDAGQNSDDNYELPGGLPLSFAGSLPPLITPGCSPSRRTATRSSARPSPAWSPSRRQRSSSERNAALSCATRTGCTPSSPGASTRPSRRPIASSPRSAPASPGEGPERPGRKWAEIAAILAPRWVARVIRTTLAGNDPAELRLSFGTDEKARAALEEELFGKRILFSDKTIEQASTSTIVAEYRSQESVEGDFRQMKDPKVVSFSPMLHFTESKIRVHVLYCVLALMAARLMVREADRAGLHLSVRALLSSLAGIQETVLLYQGERGRPRARRMLTEKDATQNRLYDLFGLDAYAPKR